MATGGSASSESEDLHQGGEDDGKVEGEHG